VPFSSRLFQSMRAMNNIGEDRLQMQRIEGPATGNCQRRRLDDWPSRVGAAWAWSPDAKSQTERSSGRKVI